MGRIMQEIRGREKIPTVSSEIRTRQPVTALVALRCTWDKPGPAGIPGSRSRRAPDHHLQLQAVNTAPSLPEDVRMGN